MTKLTNERSRLYEWEGYTEDVEERAYVSRKIYRVRWKPQAPDQYSAHFVTASYDNARTNGLDLWSFSGRRQAEHQAGAELAPLHLAGLRTRSNVTDMCFLEDRDHLAYCTDSGDVGLVRVTATPGGGDLSVRGSTPPAHWLGPDRVACSCMDVYETTLAVGSNDGRICLVATDGCKSASTIVGSAPIHSLKFVSKDELVAGSLLGSVSLWDLRYDSSSPSQSFPLCRSQRVGVTCLTVFPTERHMIVCGGRNGLISVFDARNLPIPVRVFSTTDSPIADLRFHPNRYSVLFSVSSHGTVWQWSNFFQLFDPLRKQDVSSLESAVDQSLLLEYKTVPPQVKCLLNNSKFYTNCIDLNKDRLLCGTDNECIVAFKSLQLK